MVYKQFASLYDELMRHAPYEKWLAFTKQVLKTHEQPAQTIIDLGCGTGEIAIRLAREGYEMIGVDYSSDMLTLAAQKAVAENLSIKWIKQDLRELTGLTELDMAISYCDVLNYITDIDDVAQVFQRVADCLKQGGLFIFDVHACHYVEHHLIDHTFAHSGDDVAYIWHCFAGDEPFEMYHDLTFFAKEADGTYRRFDEEHHQKTYPVHIYSELLSKAGFENIKIYTDFSLKNEEYDDEAERIFFIAEKGSGTL